MVTSKDHDETMADNSNDFIDRGLFVNYNEEYNQIIDAKVTKKYPVGGLISEFTNLEAPKIKEAIKTCSNLSEPATVEGISHALVELYDKLFDMLEPVQAIMVMTEFSNTCRDWFDSCRNNQTEEALGIFRQYQGHNEVTDFIFEGFNCTEVGGDTIEQLLCTAYLCFAGTYNLVKYAFYQLIHLEGHYTEEGEKKVLNLLGFLLSEQFSFQHMDFRIIFFDGDFAPVYTIKTALSLLLFETIHSIKKEVKFTKCANCGRVFVPEGRKDTKYCSYASPQKKDKSCKEIGAQVARQNKEKKDVYTREYRKVYGRLKMAKSRHPGHLDYSKKLDDFVQEASLWKSKLNDGTATVEQFMEWITNY